MKSVLVVEDYADLRSAIGDALARGHYACDCVSSDEDAIARLRDRHYSVILLSPRIPISNDPVIHFLQEHQPEQMSKIVLMTDPDTAPAAYRSLVKPFNREELLRQMPRE